MRRQSFAAVLCLLPLLIGTQFLSGCCCASTPVENLLSDPGPLEAEVGQYRLLTWNTWLMPLYPSKPARRAEEIVKAVQGYDIVGLQEVFLYRDQVIDGLSKTYRQVLDADEKITTRILGSGLLLATVYHVENWWVDRYDEAKGDDALASKSALYARLKVPCGLLDVIVTHAQAGGGDGKEGPRTWARHEQFEQLKRLIDKHGCDDIPRIIIGDLNVSAPIAGVGEGDEYRTMLRILSTKGVAPIDEFRRLNPPNQSGDTYERITYDYRNNTYASLVRSLRTMKRLDYLLNHNPKARAPIQQIRVRRFWYQRSSGQICPLSDHYAIEAVFGPGSRDASTKAD